MGSFCLLFLHEYLNAEYDGKAVNNNVTFAMALYFIFTFIFNLCAEKRNIKKVILVFLIMLGVLVVSFAAIVIVNVKI